MRKILLSALLASALALPAGAQLLHVQGVLVEPQNPTTHDNIRLTLVGVEGCPTTFKEPVFNDETVILNIAMAEDCVTTPIPRPFRRTYEIGQRPAGLNWVEVRVKDLPGLTRWELFEVSPGTPSLALGDDDRFQVHVNWSNPKDGSSGTGHPRRLGQDSGAFWFFSPDNLEVTVKVLDGRAVNGHWWVFIASMTDLQFEVGISRAGGPVKTYVQTAGANRNFIDVNASFVDGPQEPVSDPVRLTPEIVIEPERPTAADPVHVEVAVLNTEPDIRFTEVEGHSIFFDYSTWVYTADQPLPPLQRFTAEANVGPLAPGVYTVDVRQDAQHAFGRTFEVAAPHTQLHLQDTADSYFNFYVNLDSPLGGVGYGVPLTRESGYFWFFDPDNIELTVKILDGRAVNGSYWVFISSMTDVPFTVEVERCTSHFDPFGCGSQIYQGVQGVNQNIIDTTF
jgi:hypothetical protein